MALPANAATMFRDHWESQNPELKAKRIAQEQAVAAKAAYDAIPYATHLANAQAEVARAKEAQAAWQPEPLDEAKLAAMTPQQRMYATNPVFSRLANPHFQTARDAEANVQNVIKGHLQDQLQKQAQGYGFSWKGNKSADYHTKTVADLLRKGGITDLSQLGYSADQKNLINKETGAIVPWHKNKKGKYDVGQLGWSAKGKGLTRYKVQPDAQGNPVLFPKWKSNAPGGLGGFLLKAAPVLTSFIPGVGMLGAAAINAGLTGLQGGGLGDMLKSGALAAIGNKIGNWGANTATANLPMVGTAGITNAIADAAGGALSGGVRSAIQGRDPVTGALIGGSGSLIGSGVSGLMGQVPETGNALVDKYGRQIAGGVLKNELRQGVSGLFAPSSGAQTRQTRQTPAVAGSSSQQGGLETLDITKLLPLLAMMGQNQAAPAASQLYSGPTSSTDWLYSNPRQRSA